ncbi:MAG: ferrous iron transport protein B [Myxococcales bacterium]|jgi:ferrous iron transport protein B|nr:ferrous iron transport protein B [Myxococcales bacterium]
MNERQADASPLVLVIGNPNVGKTTLFNRLAGASGRVGNYPGVTVERRPGRLRLGGDGDSDAVELLDLPGCYSLSARSAEEQIAINAVLGRGDDPEPALALVVVDAGQIIRNLYLVLQLVELEVPLVVALNMIDEVEGEGPSAAAIERLFGVPVVATSARRGLGLEALAARIRECVRRPPRGRVAIDYPPALERDLATVQAALPPGLRASAARDRALALWALTSIDEHDELRDVDPGLRAACLAVRRGAGGRDLDDEVIATRYAFLDRYAPELLARADQHLRKRAASERIDRVLLHPVWGFAVFVTVMLVLFQALFSWANPGITLVEGATAWLQEQMAAHLPGGLLSDLLREGVVGGVGNVIVFLPQILLLFFFISLLEDSGYMARIAFLMDRIMKALGLHGRAFVPMLSGFACAVPAILATRTMERRRDRLLTMMVIPLMTCSARLPVYTLIIGALFPPAVGWMPVQGLLMVAMYLFSIVVTLAAAAVLGRTVIRGEHVPPILELPPYRLPDPRSMLRMMFERAWVFLREAGTMILACTVVLWALLSFPRPPPPSGVPSEVVRQHALAESYGGRLGRAIEPALAPLGFDWKIGVGIVGAFAAREVFVSTLGLVYGVGEQEDEAIPLRQRIQAERRPDGRPLYTPLVGLSLMVFFALACQCMSTLAVTRRETRSWRWPAFMFAYMTALAWSASFVVYQGGRWLGL